MLKIRKITAEDQEKYLQMSEEFYNSSAVLHPIRQEYREKTFMEMMKSDLYLIGFILEIDEHCAGYALLSRSFSPEAGGAVIWLEEIYLRPAFRGRGMGREFFLFLEENYPVSRYRLEVSPENKHAVQLYLSLGYRELRYTQMIKENEN
ncbi:MAG: GNAT family N-acetyltransferase [Planctomycetia bacterium]|nr:GNAT family N-acetyltransferase [Planctomycetia bacterium]